MSNNGTHITTGHIDWSAGYLPPKWVEWAGIYWVDNETGAEIVGGKMGNGRRFEGAAIPYPVPGENRYGLVRLRRDYPDYDTQPDGTKKEKGKYLSPPGSWGHRAYFAPKTPKEWLSDSAIPAIIVEGEKKAIALRRFFFERDEQVLVIALPGVWNFRRSEIIRDTLGHEAGRVSYLLQDLEKVNWSERRLRILFDANALTNPSVNSARRELGRQLLGRGARVRLVDMEPEPGINGLDDFLGKYGPESFAAFLAANPGAPVKPDLETAKKIAGQLQPRLDASPKSAFDEDVIGALAVLKESAPGEFAETRTLLKAYAIPLRLIDAEIKKVAPALRLVTDDEDGRKKAGEFLADAPLPDLIIPAGYRLEPDRTLGTVLNPFGFPSQEPISFGALLITGRTVDVDGDSEGLRLSWKRGGPWRHKIVDRGTVANSRELVGLANAGFPVTTSDSKEQVEYFAKFEAENFSALPVARTTSRLGWQATGGFLVGREFIQANGQSLAVEMRADSMEWADGVIAFRGTGLGDDQIVEAYHREGTMEKWTEAIEKLQPYPRALSVLYAAFVPPLLRIFGCPNFIIDLCSRTSLGKTTAQRAAGSVWGDPDERKPASVVKTWNNTGVYVERSSAIASSLPLILDDTKQAKKPEEIAKVIYAVAEGRGRGRGTLGGIAATKTYYTVLISSGEQPITSFTNDGGTRMRVVEIEGAPFGGETPDTAKIVQAIDLAVKANFGHAGPVFVRYLIENENLHPEWKKEFQARVKTFAESASGTTAGRLATYAAAITQAATLVHTALDLPWSFEDPVKELWKEISNEADDPIGAKRALRLLVSWAWANEVRFIGREQENIRGVPSAPSSGWLGRWDRGEDYKFIAFYPHILKEFLEKHEFYPEAILTEWRESEWLDVEKDDRKRFTKKYRIRGPDGSSESPHFIAIRREGIDAIEK